MRIAARAVALAAGALVLTSCEDMIEGFGDMQRFKEDFRIEQPLKSGGRLYVENLNGSVEIAGWEKDSVEISGTKYAASEVVLRGLKIDVSGTDGSVRIRTIAPSGARGSHGAKYMLRVPHKIQLESIASSNGSIRIDSLEGPARLRTSNGSIRVLRLKGALEVHTSNATIEVNDQAGSVVARTSNGGIRADGVRGAFEATTSNGSIQVRLTDPEQGRPLRLESSNGSIELTMDRLAGNDIRAQTSNSSITLRLPSSLNAQLKAHAGNSSITTDFDLAVRSGQLSKSNVEGVIGSGGPLLDLSTSNGSVKVLKI